jgi:hemerythrin
MNSPSAGGKIPASQGNLYHDRDEEKAMLIEWSDELSVGIQEIDEQHKVLVSLLNEMHDAIHERHGREASIRILKRLTEYTKIHFAVEESLMRIFDYPGYEEHKKQHEQLIQEILDLEYKIIEEEHAISFQLLHFLKMWLTKHILESDMDYGPFFLKAGLREKSRNQGWFKRLWH